MVTGYLKARLWVDRNSTESISEGARQDMLRGSAYPGRFRFPQLFIELTAAEKSECGGLRHAHAGTFISFPGGKSARTPRQGDRIAGTVWALPTSRTARSRNLQAAVRKLVDIAMALVRRPKLLLLDEPTSGVSAEEKIRHHGSRNSCRRRPMPQPSSSSNTTWRSSAAMPDRVLAFYQGRILADGDPRDVLKDPEVRRYVTGGVR